jgi:FtsP/CotA-like multicopper oxidase with cupredoxin domain
MPRHEALAAESPDLHVDRRTIEVNGRAATVFGIRQPHGDVGLSLAPGQRFQVRLVNRTLDPTIVHWHGQTPPVAQDGVPDTGFAAPIAPGANQLYDFAPRTGTHWMHAHYGLQEQQLLAAPLIVASDEDRKLDAQEVTVLLHDFTFRDPAEMLASLKNGTGMSNTGVAMTGHAAGAMTMPMAGSEHAESKTTRKAEREDLNEVNYDAYLANDRTLDDPLVIRTERRGRVRLRLINGATATAFWIDLGALDGTVLAVDGNPVQPVSGRLFPLAEGQRLDLLVPLPAASGAFPVLAQREGEEDRTGIILASPSAAIAKVSSRAERSAAAVDLSLERQLVATQALATRPAAITHRIALTGSMMPYVWSIDERTWSNHQPLGVRKGQRVVIEMVNRSPMAHPMHLHGHHFQVVALNGAALNGALRDTVLVPASGSVTIAFDADNPGRWLLHCHNLLHMATGMMTEIAYDLA